MSQVLDTEVPVDEVASEGRQIENTIVLELHEVGGAADAGGTDCVRSEQLVYGARVREPRCYEYRRTATFQLQQTPLKVLYTAQLP